MASKYNHEGYYDSTAYYAIQRIELEQAKSRFRPLVYICSPYSGNIYDNVLKARKYSRFAVDSKYIPITPHLFFPQFMDDSTPDERELAMLMNRALLSKCSELWVFGSRISSGMNQEIKRAMHKRMKIRYFTEELEELR